MQTPERQVDTDAGQAAIQSPVEFQGVGSDEISTTVKSPRIWLLVFALLLAVGVAFVAGLMHFHSTHPLGRIDPAAHVTARPT